MTDRKYDPTDAPSLGADGTFAFQARVRGTNINEQTLLATDYLNHFNEIVMVVEMIPDMPNCLEDARQWQPKSYREHFRDGSFGDKDLAIAAYEHVPPRYLKPFEDTVARMNRLVEVSLDRIEAALAGGNAAKTKIVTTTATRALQNLIDVASAIIHGAEIAMGQDEIDDLFQD